LASHTDLGFEALLLTYLIESQRTAEIQHSAEVKRGEDNAATIRQHGCRSETAWRRHENAQIWREAQLFVVVETAAREVVEYESYLKTLIDAETPAEVATLRAQHRKLVAFRNNPTYY